MKLAWTTPFSGIRPKVDERLLPDGNAQVAENIYTDRGGIRPLRGTRDIAGLPRATSQTIYRFGQALQSETQYWFSWAGDVDVAKGPIADDTNERTYWTGDGAPKYTTAALGTGAGTNLPAASRPLGVAAPASAPILTVSGDPIEDGSEETRVYIYTFVTDMGEESAPSSPSTVTFVMGQTVTLSGMLTTATNGAVLATKRIYRAQRGQYLFVAEIPAATTTYTDTLSSDLLGEICPSIEWDTPPATLKALTPGPNGMMAAVDGYTVRFCEPFRPHAWPMAYSQTMPYPCVGLGQFGQAFVVLTTGLPYIIEGVHPANMAVATSKFYQPCLAKRSIVSTGGDVIWASPDGLVSLGASGENNLTDEIFTPEQWRALKPETMTGAWHEGWYVGTYNPGTGIKGFMLRPATREWVDLPGLAATAFYRDTVGDALYMAIGNRIHQFRSGSTFLTYTWKSQEVISALSDFTAARVTGGYPVTFKFYRDRVLRFTKTVASDEPFKLPAGIGRSWAVEVSGTNETLGIAIATAEAEL